MKVMKPSFEGIPLENGEDQPLFGKGQKPSSHGSATVHEDPSLSKAGELWQSNTAYGETLAKDSAPDLGGRYEVQGEIAHGGMGVVFRALDREVGRQIAIKILREKHQDKPEMVKRFIEEAQVTGQLQHPGVAPVYEIGYLPQKLPYFTMKLIEGSTLDWMLAERKKKDSQTACPMGWLLKIFEQVAQTVAYAHAKGVIHRDIKPHNVMVGAYGEVQVMDWGLAKPLGMTLGVKAPSVTGAIAGSIREAARGDRKEPSDPAVQTRMGAIVGTPAYMAPEQARGELDKIDRRSDVFGLGALLCEILTGKPPFPGVTGMESCDKACRADLTETYKRLEECDADAGWIVLARECLSPDPDFRPPDAGHVAARVAAYMATLESRARKAEQERAEERVRSQEQSRLRRLWRLWMAVIVLLTLAGAAAVVVWVYHRSQWEIREAQYQTSLSQAATAVERKRTDAERAVETALAQVSGFRDALQLPQARATLEQAELLAGSAPDPAVRARLNAERMDLEFISRLDGIHIDRQTARTDALKTAGEYAGAFAAAGMPVGSDPRKTASRIAGSSMRGLVEAGMDEWFCCADSPSQRAWLRQARTLLGNAAAWRPLWDCLEAGDMGSMLATAKSSKAASARLLLSCGECLTESGRKADAVQMLLLAHERSPGDLWVNGRLGILLRDEKPGDALGFCRAAVALGPEVAGTHGSLGAVLAKLGRTAEAKAARHRGAVIEVAAANAAHHRAAMFNDGNARQVAKAAYERALALDPGFGLAHHELGTLLAEMGQNDAAKASYERALTLDPDMEATHAGLAGALISQGRAADALVVLDRALARFPKSATLHFSRGNALGALLRNREAVGAYQQAEALDPGMGLAYCNEGVVWERLGDYAKAIAVTERGISIGRQTNPQWTYGVAWLADYKQKIEIRARLEVVLAGQDSPSNGDDAAALAKACLVEGRISQALRLFEAALRPAAADWQPAVKGRAVVFYDAACAALLEARKPGLGAAKVAELRGKALDWLRQSLGEYAVLQQRRESVEERYYLENILRHWFEDPDLSAVRDEAALAKLPDGEQALWLGLWVSWRRMVE